MLILEQTRIQLIQEQKSEQTEYQYYPHPSSPYKKNTKYCHTMHSQKPQSPTETVHLQIHHAFTRLLASINELTDPQLVDHCRIWKHEKGARRLIELAVRADRFLGTEARGLRKVYGLVRREEEQEGSSGQGGCGRGMGRVKGRKEEEEEEEGSGDEGSSIMCKEEEQEYSKSQLKMEQPDSQSNSPQEKANSLHQPSLLKLEPINPQIPQDPLQPPLPPKSQPRTYQRGPYKNYSRETKQKMVQLYKSSSLPISKISHMYGIPIKNIKRWAQNGIERKQGAGRKRLDPSMQQDLLEKIGRIYETGSRVQVSEIRFLALTLSRVEEFKASKGWVLSFVERYQLNSVYRIV